MADSFEQFGLRVISGKDRSLRAAILRGGLRAIEPFYAGAMRVRNACYDHGIFNVHDLGRPTISVGNITTGGTGKTPVVQWLAARLRARGHRPAVLLRGYGSSSSGLSDEAQLLDQSLNGEGRQLIPVMADPSRLDGAARVLAEHPAVTHFILDDGFQHRRAKRDFNLVLISATEPFGYGHVLPRGLLREPLSGLARADAFLITRCGLVPMQTIRAIEKQLNDRHPAIPVFRCHHVQKSVWLAWNGQSILASDLRNRRVFLSSGIGDPASFEQQVARHKAVIAGSKWWPDHHSLSASELDGLIASATNSGAEMLITTAKDWVKMRTSPPAFPVGVVQMKIAFRYGDEARLLKKITG